MKFIIIFVPESLDEISTYWGPFNSESDASTYAQAKSGPGETWEIQELIPPEK